MKQKRDFARWINHGGERSDHQAHCACECVENWLVLTRLSAFNQINTLIHRSRPHALASTRAHSLTHTRPWICMDACIPVEMLVPELMFFHVWRFMRLLNGTADIVVKCEYVWCECEWMRNVPISFDLHCHRMLIYKYNKNNCSSLAIHEYRASWLRRPVNACTYFVVSLDDDSILHLYRPLNGE